MKMKTKKSIAKRVRLTGTKANRFGKVKKLLRKSAGQNHFNARDAGKNTINKRRGKEVKGYDKKNIVRLLPYA